MSIQTQSHAVSLWRAVGSTLLGAIVPLLFATAPLTAQADVSVGGAVESRVGGFGFPNGSIQTTTALPTVPVFTTGQTACWNTAGATVACAGTGQDGELQRGVAWPDPRFLDNGDGTVTDEATGLVWLQDADCLSGPIVLDELITQVQALEAPDCGLTDGSQAGDWRLPNVNELITLVDYGTSSPALPPGHPFANVRNAYYASSTAVVQSNGTYGGLAHVRLFNSQVTAGSIDGVLLVRGGGSTSVPATGDQACWDYTVSTATTKPCAGSGQDGERQAGASWPSPRFTSNGDGTVTDRLTQLVWLRDPNCLGEITWDQALAGAQTLADGHVACNLNDGSSAGDWRLPNVRELLSMLAYIPRQWDYRPGFPFPSMPTDPFWTSTSFLDDPSKAWTLFDFILTPVFGQKTDVNLAWAVRDL